MRQSVPLIFERCHSGRRAVDLPAADVPRSDPQKFLPAGMLRAEPAALPEVSQPDLIRHFYGAFQTYLRSRQWILPSRVLHNEVQSENK